jgi:hypothetical protein
MRLPESIEVRVEESADTIYLVLPSTSPVGEGSDLSYQELDAVAGGFGGTASGVTCGTAVCPGFTCDEPGGCG